MGRIDDLVAGMRPDTLGAGIVGGEAQDEQGDQEDAERAADDGQRLLLRGQRRPGRLGGQARSRPEASRTGWAADMWGTAGAESAGTGLVGTAVASSVYLS